MLKTVYFYIFLCASLVCFGQQKGLNPIAPIDKNQIKGNKYAVIVGISDYQNEEISDLQFADKDAEAFTAYLQSSSGGAVPQSNIIKLINNEATAAAVAGAIDWLVEIVQEGDEAYIYFSGHGDVERKALSQPGFLLCWDSGPKIYMAGGTYSLYFLQDMISTISIEKKAKIILIADACRSGKLAGSAVHGAQLTTANLSKQYANELKILSCQPDEYSLEGIQWGGGRGAFSFHLLEGLTGLADANEDQSVSLLEIERYLQDHVSEEVAPQSQLPMTVGSKRESVSIVDKIALISLQNNKSIQDGNISDIVSKTNVLVFKSDSIWDDTYTAFENAIQNKQYLKPENNCADFYYSILVNQPELADQKTFLTRKYAVALQDDAQQTINLFLKDDPNTIVKSRIEYFEAYKEFPKLLNRAAELLGKDHYMYNDLKAREYLFDGVLLHLKYNGYSDATLDQGNEILSFYQKALALKTEFPLIHYFMSLCYGKFLKEPKNATLYAEKAMENAGSWVMPYVYLAYNLSKEEKDFEKAEKYLKIATDIDSNNVNVWKGWTSLYFYQRDFTKALEAANKSAFLDPTDPFSMLNVGLIKLSMGKFEEAENALIKCIALDSNLQLAYYYLGYTYEKLSKDGDAENCYKKALQKDPDDEKTKTILTNLYTKKEKYLEAEVIYLTMLNHVANHDKNIYFDLAYINALNKKQGQSLHYLELAFKNGFSDLERIQKDEAFQQTIALKDYQKLLQTSFK